MAFSINRVTLLGNLTRDPDLKYTKNKIPVMVFNMATNHSVKKSDDSWEDVPTFHRIVVWGKFAEWLHKNLAKGSKVYVDGRIQTREYEDKSGNMQRSREIVANNVIPMSNTDVQRVQAEDESVDEDEPMDETVDPDDIPF